MRLNHDQIELIAKTFADIAKILFASAVVGFFIPGSTGAVSIPTFIVGAAFAVGIFGISVFMLKSEI